MGVLDTIQGHYLRAREITPEMITRELFEFIRSIEKELVALNRDQLQNKSIDVYGDAIGFYSKATEVITGGRKKAGEPFDVYETGGVLGKLYAKIQGDTLYIGSTDPKVQLIMDSDNWLSHDLFGLTDENLQEVIATRTAPFLIQLSKKKLLTP